MRPPTRSTRSVRPSLNTNNVRRSRSTAATGPSSSHPAASRSSESSEDTTGSNNPNLPKPTKPQSIIVPTSAAADAKVDPGTSPGSDPAPANANAPVVGCFPVLPSSTFIYENQNQSQSQNQSPSESLLPASPNLSVAGSIILGGKPPRARHRMSTDKLEALDAFFRRNTHPSRKEKEAICKDIDMDLKTVTIWFQNRRQNLARSKRQLSSEGATSPTAAIDLLAYASATMSPLVASEETSASLASVPVQPGSVAQGSYPDSPSLNQSTSRPQRTSSCDSIPKAYPQALAQTRVPLSAVPHDSHVFVFESVRTEMPSPSRVSSPSTDLRKPHLGGDRAIHPEDLWKHIPSSPALSSPDVSPDMGTPSRSSRLLVQRPRTLEWACARSAKRRRTNPGTVYQEDGQTDSECNPIDDTGICRSSFSISEARVPLECYDKYPLDVVHGAILLLGLRDAAVDLEL